MTALLLPETTSHCLSCGHDHRGCDCTCECGAERRLPAGRGTAVASLVCDRPPHDPVTDPLHYDREDHMWWLEDNHAR